MKRRISLIFLLIVSMLAGLFGTTVYVGADTAAETDAALYDRINLLEKLGIIDYIPDAEILDEEVTRGEAVNAVARLRNIEFTGDDSTVYFYDVPPEHAYFKAINFCYENGYISGYETSQTFRPDDSITVLEASSSILKLAGYKQYIDYQGGYPLGYANVASRTGLTSGIDLNTNDALTVRGLMKLLYNALKVGYVRENGFSYAGGQEMYASVDTDKTILESFFNIRPCSGVLVSTEDASFDNTESRAGTIVIRSGKQYLRFKNTDRSLTDYIGYKMEAYVSMDDGQPDEVVAALIDYDSVSEEVFLTDDVVSVDKSVSHIRYNNGSKSKDINCTGATIIYNGREYFGVSAEELQKAPGTVRAVDSGSDGTFDLLFLNVYTPCIVESVSITGGFAVDRITGDVISLDEHSDEYDLTIVRKTIRCI